MERGIDLVGIDGLVIVQLDGAIEPQQQAGEACALYTSKNLRPTSTPIRFVVGNQILFSSTIKASEKELHHYRAKKNYTITSSDIWNQIPRFRKTTVKISTSSEGLS